MQSKCSVCGIKKTRFAKEQEAKGLLSNLGIKTPLKVLSATFMLVCFLSLNERTCQTRKNVFYFTSKALFVFEKIKF